MKGRELVWRTLFDASTAGRRRWSNLDDLAFASGVPKTSTFRTVQKLVRIGALETLAGGGFIAVSPDKILTLMCAERDLAADTLLTTTLNDVEIYLDSSRGPYAIGGADAAITYLPAGLNTVAHFHRRLVYLTPEQAKEVPVVEDGDVTVLTMDHRASLDWGNGYSSLGQTYADLFASPGWQASEFRWALWDAHFATRDWEEKLVNGHL